MANSVQSDQLYGAGDWAYGYEDTESTPVYPEDQLSDIDNYRPSAATLIILIAVFLLPKSLVASAWGRYLPLPFGLYIYWSELWFITMVLLVLIARGLGGFSYGISRTTKRWYLMPMLLFGLLQIISLSWNSRSGLERGYSFLQTLYMVLPVLTAVLLVSGLSYINRMKVVCWLVLILTFIMFVYMGLSFAFPGLRPSTAWIDRLAPGLGFIRVFGPLSPSTSLNFILFPILGFTTGLLFIPGRSKAFWGFITFVIFVTIIGTGSRGAILCMVAFVLLLLVALRVFRALKVITPVALILGTVLLFTGLPKRFVTMEDPSRSETYKTAFRVFTSSPGNVIIGTGHGGFYSLLHDNTLRILHGRGAGYLHSRETEFGYSLTNSHSTYFQALIETGLIGFVLLMIALLWIIRFLLGRRYRQCLDPWTIQARLTLAGCTASMVLMITSVFFYNLPWLVFIWSIFAITATETTAESSWLLENEPAYEADELAYYSDKNY